MVLTAGEGVQQRGVRGGCRGRTVLLFGFADLGVALGKFQPDRLRDVRIEPHTLFVVVHVHSRVVCVWVRGVVAQKGSCVQKKVKWNFWKKKKKTTIKHLAIFWGCPTMRITKHSVCVLLERERETQK